MKKSLLIFSVVLLIAGLFISCNSEAAGSEEDLVYVSFADDGKGLNSSITPWNPGTAPTVDSLTWYYKASKASGAQQGATGDVWTRVNNTTGLGGQIGPFSVGYWTFQLIGCNGADTSAVVYEGSTDGTVKLTRGTNQIAINLSWHSAPTPGSTATINWNVTYSVEATGSMYCTITSGETNLFADSVQVSDNKITLSGNTTPTITTDFTPITLTFAIYDAEDAEDADLKVAENSITFPGLKGSTVAITGTLDDLGSAYVVITGTTPSAPVTNAVNVNENTVAYTIKDSIMYGFASLDEALEEADDGDTVGLLKEVTYGADHTVDVWHTYFNLDFNGHTYKTESTVDVTASNMGYKASAICYEGSESGTRESFTISDGTILTRYGAGIYVDGMVDVTIENVSITQNYPQDCQTTDEYSSAVRLTSKAKATINSGSFYGKHSVAVSNSGGEVTINGGTFSASLFFNEGTNSGVTKSITINGGTFTATSIDEFVVNRTYGTLTIHGGTFHFNPSSLLTSGYTAVQTGENVWTVSAN